VLVTKSPKHLEMAQGHIFLSRLHHQRHQADHGGTP
jgi:hypothetical protein